MNFCQSSKPILRQAQYGSTRPISISLSPNTEKDDIDLALKLIFQPWKWKSVQKSAIAKNWTNLLEEEFKRYFGVKYAFSFNSGRAGLMAILEALGIGENQEVLLQGFTCNAAVNPILEKGAKPVFVDVDDTINIDPEDLKKKITHSAKASTEPFGGEPLRTVEPLSRMSSGQASKIKAVMIQHNFGWPAKVAEISEICKKHNLYLIEDCAHSLGAKYRDRYCGTFGDAAFFSFGRDKIISSVFGGMAVTDNDKIGERIKNFRDKLDYPSNLWIFQQLLHPILTNYLVLPAYGLNSTLGRIILGLFHILKVLSKGVYKKEKKGKMPDYFPKKFPNALAILALNQFKKLERFNEHRREIANFYESELKNTKFVLPLSKSRENITPTFMRYPILTKMDTDKILEQARKKKIYLDDGWRKTPIVPPDTDISKMKYEWRSCPQTEKVAKTIVNLPTHVNISKTDAQKIVDFLKQFHSANPTVVENVL